MWLWKSDLRVRRTISEFLSPYCLSILWFLWSYLTLSVKTKKHLKKKKIDSLVCPIGACKISLFMTDTFCNVLYLATHWDFSFGFDFISTDLKRASNSNAAKSGLPKSGLRPPGYSRLPAAKLAAFGFVRSSSVSAVPSTQSLDSAQPEQSRPVTREWGKEVEEVGGEACALPGADGRQDTQGPRVLSLIS